MTSQEFYFAVNAQYKQYQDGAITFAELCNTLLALGSREGRLVVSEGCFYDSN